MWNPFACLAAYVRFIYANLLARYLLRFKDIKNGVHYTDKDRIERLLKANGFVVVRLPQEKVHAEEAVQEMWGEMEDRLRGTYVLRADLDRRDQNTWGVFEAEMIDSGLHSKDPTVGTIAMGHRMMVEIHDIFKKLFKNDDLYVSIDRYGLLRPGGKDPLFLSSADWVHWDTNPRYPESQDAACLYKAKRDLCVEIHDLRRSTQAYDSFQGLLNLTDSDAQGGFQCVPGVHHIVPFLHFPFSTQFFSFLPKSSFLNYFLLQVPASSGTLIIWNSLLPHSNYQNLTNDRIRCVQYITMYPKDCIPLENQALRRELLLETLRDENTKPPADPRNLLGL
eukprot:TRINITY_DN28640_c0_g1_i1.p1 TRINITY_DN28640_c0_g1~~TRINITY_DN28640_c0_g1_i1.p1  ORF type:complete len:336 (+),score=49.28 TRINITY_DN28640_c0_g1_i1:35-1042(+)